jgi:hypothetical protein
LRKKTTATVAGPNIDIQIELWAIERLIPRANNPRTHSRDQVAHIAASIREFGLYKPDSGRRRRRYHRWARTPAGRREARHERSAGDRPPPFVSSTAAATERIDNRDSADAAREKILTLLRANNFQQGPKESLAETFARFLGINSRELADRLAQRAYGHQSVYLGGL